MNLYKSIILLLFLVQGILFSQIHSEKFNKDSCETDFVHNIKHDFNTFINVGVDYFVSPFHFDKEDFLISGLIVKGTAFSFILDNPVREASRRNHSKTMNGITSFAKNFGEPVYGTVLSTLLYVGGHISGNKYIRETGVMLFEAMVLNGFVTGSLKTILGRSRPYNNKGSMEFHFFNFEFDNNYQSLPSGHTSTAFTIATVLSERIDNIYASILLYTCAGMTAYERIYDDKHWFSDTVLGAAIGTVTGLAVVRLYTKASKKKDECTQLIILPTMGREVYGLNLSLRF